MTDIKKIIGCLIGGAAGDALGYAVEFDSISSIKSKYGKNGIIDYQLKDGLALISDDTQMSMFTLNSLTYAAENSLHYIDCISDAYHEWLFTQNNSFNKNRKSNFKIMQEPRLYSCRTPGCTCLNALESGKMGTINNPINNSKGCGGIMRVAPIGLFFNEKVMPLNKIALLGAQASALTHGHELGYIPSYFLCYLINLLSHRRFKLINAVKIALISTQKEFSNTNYIDDFVILINKAIDLSQENIDNLKAFEILGEGWVAEETAAIAVYCSLKYQNDFDRALIASVNHSGDSDSTGAVTGNILGAYLGIDRIPGKYIRNLELKDLLYSLSLDIFYSNCNIEKTNKKMN